MVRLHALPAPLLEDESPAVLADRLREGRPSLEKGDEVKEIRVRVLKRYVVEEGDERVREPLRMVTRRRQLPKEIGNLANRSCRTSGKTVALKTTLPPRRSRRKRELQPLPT